METSSHASAVESLSSCGCSSLEKMHGSTENSESLRILKTGRYCFGFRDQYTIKAQGVEYSVPVVLPMRKTYFKTILGACSFNISPGKMLVILGASGAGKSTLLDILAGRISRNKYTGYVLANDQLMSRRFRSRIGYVMQSDQLYPMLTVKETLYFAAQLRVRDVPREELEGLVDMTLDLLHLGSVQNRYVGNEGISGISGGERRRCTIGVDIIHQPSVIYLDEPTSGLDSSMALRITKMLKGICSRGSRTVCMTIHQPSIKVYDCMDEVMFLHKGRILYKDSSHGVVNYMKKKFDVAVPDFANCAELFLEYVAEHEEDGDFETNLTCDDSEHFPMTERGSSIIPDRRASIDKPRKLRTYTRSLMTEVWILSHREFLNFVRTPGLFHTRLLLYTLMGFLIASVFVGTGYETVSEVTILMGFFAFALGFLLFSSLDQIAVFYEECLIFGREYSQGAYSSISYNLSHAVVMTPMYLLFSFILHITTYFFIGLPLSANVFFFQWLLFFTLLFTSGSFCIMLSALCRSPKNSDFIANFVFSVMYIMSGIFISTSDIPKAWNWFGKVNFFEIACRASLRNVVDEAGLDDAELEEIMDVYGRGIQHNKYLDWLQLVGISFGIRVVFNIALVTLCSGKRH